jgi:hypothetical protein
LGKEIIINHDHIKYMSLKNTAAKFIRNSGLTKTGAKFAKPATKSFSLAKGIGSSVIGLGAAAAAGAYGAYKINKASKALNKSIDAQTSKSGMKDHQRMLDRSMKRKEAAAKLRKAKQPKAPDTYPGGQWTKGYDHKLWD